MVRKCFMPTIPLLSTGCDFAFMLPEFEKVVGKVVTLPIIFDSEEPEPSASYFIFDEADRGSSSPPYFFAQVSLWQDVASRWKPRDVRAAVLSRFGDEWHGAPHLRAPKRGGDDVAYSCA